MPGGLCFPMLSQWPVCLPQDHPLVHLLTKVPKQHLGLGTAVPKRDINIFYVANQQGVQKFVRPSLAKELREALQSLTGKPFPDLAEKRKRRYNFRTRSTHLSSTRSSAKCRTRKSSPGGARKCMACRSAFLHLLPSYSILRQFGTQMSARRALRAKN